MQLNQTLEFNFFNIQEKLLVETDNSIIFKHYQQLFNTLISKYSFRKNRYHCFGSFDLSAWVVACFQYLLHTNEEMFNCMLLLIAYLSIVDDALDEVYDEKSIAEMQRHLDIFISGEVDQEHINPSIKMALHIVSLLDEKPEIYASIKMNAVQFLKTGIVLLTNATNATKIDTKVERRNLTVFLKERRVDSMAKLFISINLRSRGLEEPKDANFELYSNMCCDVISIINDVASLSKDVHKNVTNNYIMLHHCAKNNIPISHLTSLQISAFETSLQASLRTVDQMMTKMNTLTVSSPHRKEFEAVDEIIKGYCSWCFTSKRFRKFDHILNFYNDKKDEKSAKSKEALMKMFKFEHADENTYYMDLQKVKNVNNM